MVRTSSLSTTIKLFEPIDQSARGQRKEKQTFHKLLQGANDTFRIYKEFYIPMQSFSIHFMRTKLCFACANGFEVVAPETLDMQSFLDPGDESLDFVRRKGDNSLSKPMAVFRLDKDFLLCYDGTYFGSPNWQVTPGR